MDLPAQQALVFGCVIICFFRLKEAVRTEQFLACRKLVEIMALYSYISFMSSFFFCRYALAFFMLSVNNAMIICLGGDSCHSLVSFDGFRSLP